MTAVDCFVQIAGFLIQTVPIAILFFVPFQNCEMRLPKRIILPLTCGVLVLLSIGFALVSWIVYAPTVDNNDNLRTITNLYMLGSLILITVLFFVNVRTKITKKFLVLVLLIHYAAILFTLTSIIDGEFGSYTVDEPILAYEALTDISSLLLVAISSPFIALFLRKEICKSFSVMENRSLRRGCAYLSVTLLLYCCCVFVLTNFNFYYGLAGGTVFAVLMMFILTDVMVYYIFFSEVRLAAENQHLADQLHNFREQYRQISSNIEESKRIRHDMHHHLNAISTLNQEGKYQELTAYLKRYTDVFQELEQFTFSGSPAIDNILNYSMGLAKEEGIAIKTDFAPFREPLTLDVIDMTVILGNLMENAIEACRQLPKDSLRFIHIWMQKKDRSLLIQIENTCLAGGRESAEFTDGTEFTSTKPAAFHGQGLKSICYVAAKYGGSAEFKKENGIFTARVVLNLLQETSPVR